MAGYRNEKQHGDAIQLMLEASGLDPFKNLEPLFINGFWTEEFEDLMSIRRKLSSGERIMLDAALCLWNWNKDFALIELVSLEPRLARLVLGLYMAWIDGPVAVDQWMEHSERGGGNA